MKCKTCSKEFIPPRRNILNCSKCMICKKAQNHPEGASSNAESESEENDKENEEIESDEQNDAVENEHNIEQKTLKSNQLSSSEMICGSVKLMIVVAIIIQVLNNIFQ